jgi:hypothetical protein
MPTGDLATMSSQIEKRASPPMTAAPTAQEFDQRATA